MNSVVNTFTEQPFFASSRWGGSFFTNFSRFSNPYKKFSTKDIDLKLSQIVNLNLLFQINVVLCGCSVCGWKYLQYNMLGIVEVTSGFPTTLLGITRLPN